MRRLVQVCVFTIGTAVTLVANHPATFVMQNGERISGDLSYKGGTAYTINGRDIESRDVAVISFVNEDPPAAELRQIPRVDNNPTELERHVFVGRDGQVMLGKLYKFSPDGETVTFDARDGGRRDISANDLARIYINPGGARSVYRNILRDDRQSTATNRIVNGSGTIRVNGNQPWTDTGVDVKKGDRVSFSASGEVRVAQGNSPEVVANPDGAVRFQGSRNSYPYPGIAVGGLIARVGNDRPFAIGTITQPISMPDKGRLYLGINDDVFNDNSGGFNVTVNTNNRTSR